jgi:two-component system, NtrC family, nitrogen regulation sensor histidine kinase NtrY
MPLLGNQARRKRKLLVLTGFLLLVGLATAINFEMLTPDLPVASNILLFALFNLNLAVFLLLLVLLCRNLVKLWFERRQNVIGARFKTKLVLAFLSLALAPAILIFVTASNFLNRAIEGWFKPQVERPLDQALAVAQTYYQNLQSTALRHAHHLARVIDRDGLLAEARREALVSYLIEQQEQLGLSALSVLSATGQELAHLRAPELRDLPTAQVGEGQLHVGLGGQAVTTVRELESGDLVEAIVPVFATRQAGRQIAGVVVVGTHVPERLEARIRAIEQSFREYKQLELLRAPIKGITILLFLLLTLIIVFSFTWFGLYLASGITGPIAELVEGTREVAAGNLSFKVQARADDEIGTLVESFNRMTDDLSESKRRLEEAYLDLQDKHTELEERRHYTETVLEAITTGVLSLDAQGRLTTLNRAAARMFELDGEGGLGRPLETVLDGPVGRGVATLVQRIRRTRAGPVEQEITVRRDGGTVTLLASGTALRGPEGEYAGAVIVFDDLTELLKAQRLAAWREVAQRIAHEIKNPLTPIQLSAQRLRRRLGRLPAEEWQLVTECTGTIVQEVDALKRLVDEFSRFARMPALTPRPTDLRPLVDAVAVLYREAHPGLRLVTRYPDDLPLVDVDADHLKRAILNLVDNAAEAVGGRGEVDVEVAYAPGTGQLRLVVSDDGPGIRPEDRERVFLPYFSTKTTGMGLGLPIVHEIVAEHGGSVRLEDNRPSGSRFVIELPVARATAPVAV